MPEQVITARVGGVLEVARGLLREKREAELAGLEEDIVALMLADRPPPEPLRLGVRSRKAGPESLAAPGHAERAIRAFAVLVAERGYNETTVDDVVKRASMSARTFYANFSGKEDLMAAAIDSGCAQAVAAVMPAFSRHGDWPDAVRAGYGALFDFFASRPALGRLLVVDANTAGDAAIERRSRGLAPLAALLEINTSEWVHMAPVIYDLLAGGVQTLLYETVSKSGTSALPALAPICTYLTVAPFIGAEAACSAANGSRPGESGTRGRWSITASAGAVPFSTPVQLTVMKSLTFLERGPATASEIAAEVGEEVAVVAGYMADLASIGAVETVGEGEETRYASPSEIHKLKIVSSRQMAMMSPEERDDMTADTLRIMDEDVEQSRASGLFDERLDRYLTRTPMTLDEAGWRELTDLHARTLHEGFEIQARSRLRLEQSDESRIYARSVQLAFEVPGAEQTSEESQSEGAEQEPGAGD